MGNASLQRRQYTEDQGESSEAASLSQTQHMSLSKEVRSLFFTYSLNTRQTNPESCRFLLLAIHAANQ